MSTVLDILRASGGSDVEIPTLELTCDAWADSLFLCAGFDDLTATTEDFRVVTFQASGMDVSLPKANNDGTQSLGIAIDNVTGEAQRRVDQANDAGKKINMIYRVYLESDLSAPADNPLLLEALSAQISGPTINFTGGYFNLIGAAWPRTRYTATFAPGLKYMT